MSRTTDKGMNPCMEMKNHWEPLNLVVREEEVSVSFGKTLNTRKVDYASFGFDDGSDRRVLLFVEELKTPGAMGRSKWND